MSHDITRDGELRTLNLHVRSIPFKTICSLSSVGSAAPALQAGGHWFESNREHNKCYIWNMEKNELKKELMKAKTLAYFSHYCAGNLYYKFSLDEWERATYQFPIATVERAGNTADGDGHWLHHESPIELSPDLGTTAFNAHEKASMLWRWINRAIDAGELLKVN